ncbi:MAG: hypothetical protein O3B82_04160, partial [Bacteroidetes bacterium]|nr:hypothetical protein [Bacteroidota bacterium]
LFLNYSDRIFYSSIDYGKIHTWKLGSIEESKLKIELQMMYSNYCNWPYDCFRLRYHTLFSKIRAPAFSNL